MSTSSLFLAIALNVIRFVLINLSSSSKLSSILSRILINGDYNYYYYLFSSNIKLGSYLNNYNDLRSYLISCVLGEIDFLEETGEAYSDLVGGLTLETFLLEYYI